MCLLGHLHWCSDARGSSEVPGMKYKGFPNHHSHCYSLARFSYVSFTMLDNTKRTLNWGLHLSWWHLNKEGFSCIGVWGEDLAKSVSSPSGALAVQEFLSHFIPIALWGIWLFKSQSYWIKKSVPGAAFCHEAKFDLCTAQFWLAWSPVCVFSKLSALLLIWDCWAV